MSQARGQIRFCRLPAESQSPESVNNSETLVELYPVLSEIDDPPWTEILQQAKTMQIPVGTEIYNGFNRCRHFVLMVQGSVRVYHHAPDGREITLYRVVPGDLCVLSLTSLLKDRHYNVTATAETDITAVGLTEEQFRRAVAESEKFRDYVLSTLSERLCDLMCLVQDTVFQNLHVRIACALDRLFRKNNSLRFSITHQEIAHEIGSTREVVSRILKEFEKEEYIKISRGSLEIMSYDDIHRLAHPSFC